MKNFAKKYVFDGKEDIILLDYFEEIMPEVKDFSRDYRNIKTRMISVAIGGFHVTSSSPCW